MHPNAIPLGLSSEGWLATCSGAEQAAAEATARSGAQRSSK
jgi:hypothetical protein